MTFGYPCCQLHIAKMYRKTPLVCNYYCRQMTIFILLVLWFRWKSRFTSKEPRALIKEHPSYKIYYSLRTWCGLSIPLLVASLFLNQIWSWAKYIPIHISRQSRQPFKPLRMGCNSLYFVWYGRAAGIAPIFQVIYTSISHEFFSNIR